MCVHVYIVETFYSGSKILFPSKNISSLKAGSQDACRQNIWYGVIKGRHLRVAQNGLCCVGLTRDTQQTRRKSVC